MKIAREGLPFVATVALAGVASWVGLGPWFALPLWLLLGFVLWFFRDPERQVPSGVGLWVSPADGRILEAGPRRVSIFMNVFDVHVCRAPDAGRVEQVRRHAGGFLAAFKDEAAERNERVTLTLFADSGERLQFSLVAGLVARRIVCRVAPGDLLARGGRVGLIRFGSRVDVELPDGARPSVSPGQRVRAGETVIARQAGAPARLV